MKLPKRFPTQLILISATILGIGAGATLYMVQETQPAEEKSSLIVKQDPLPPIQYAEPSKPVLEAPAASSVNDTTTNPSTNPEAPESPTVQPQAHKFAAEMAAAGISESDFGIVEQLVLDNNGWRVYSANPDQPIWRLARQTKGELTSQLKDVVLYVQVTYDGSWSAAQDSYVNRGNF
ncbi:hypothetical protein ABIB48_002613 [Arthrobacter sp. UYCu511]|uniref:hypothetical protein n=1 Tax=Arthrobacter sp. UYCu511 TaxID=3156337 RepID=UPI003397A234